MGFLSKERAGRLQQKAIRILFTVHLKMSQMHQETSAQFVSVRQCLPTNSNKDSAGLCSFLEKVIDGIPEAALHGDQEWNEATLNKVIVCYRTAVIVTTREGGSSKCQGAGTQDHDRLGSTRRCWGPP